jgi:hypothetical protein
LHKQIDLLIKQKKKYKKDSASASTCLSLIQYG